MDWKYIAGYGDGEACLSINIYQDKRPNKIGNSKVDGYIIIPRWTIQSYDKDVLERIKSFLEENNINVHKLCIDKSKRPWQTQNGIRLVVSGWDNLTKFLSYIIPYSISKKRQYELTKDLYKQVGRNKRGSILWTKEKFLKSMLIVDELNSYKSGVRGKYNYEYFKKLWNISK